nr:unnamed protein product [Digitaria exilis]
MYWVSKDTRSVMSFDHKDERVAFVTTLPVRVQLCLDRSWHLTIDTTGRMLGLPCGCWIWKETSRKERGFSSSPSWSQGTSHFKSSPGLTSPMVIGEHVLTTRVRGSGSGWLGLHACWLRMGEARTTMRRGKAQTRWPPAISLYDDYCVHGPYAKTTEPFIRTFAYVETTEPLALL